MGDKDNTEKGLIKLSKFTVFSSPLEHQHSSLLSSPFHLNHLFSIVIPFCRHFGAISFPSHCCDVNLQALTFLCMHILQTIHGRQKFIVITARIIPSLVSSYCEQ